MKPHKLTYLALVLICNFLFTNAMELAESQKKIKSDDDFFSYENLIKEMQLWTKCHKKINHSTRNRFKDLPEELIEKILISTNNLDSVSKTCKDFRKTAQKILKSKWDKLKAQQDLQNISKAINSLGLPKTSNPTYNDFSTLYYSLAEDLDIDTSKPEDLDITEIEIYKDMNKKIEDNRKVNIFFTVLINFF